MTSPASDFGVASSSGGGSTPASDFGAVHSGSSASSKKTKKKHGLLGTLKAIPGAAAQDLYDAALESPAGAAAVAEAVGEDLYSRARHPLTVQHNTKLDKLAKAYVQQTKETVKHPLRHPGDTALTVLPVIGGAARGLEGAAAASRAVKAGESASAVAKAAVKPPSGARVLTKGTAVSKGHYSKAAAARVVQKTVDKTLQGAKPGSRLESFKHGRMAKWNERALRVEEAQGRAAGTRLQKLGSKLTPAQLYALRVVAEEVPLSRRTAAQELRMARATGKEAARHQERVDLGKAAQQFIDESSGKPEFAADAPKSLRATYEALQSAAGDRGEVLKHLGLLDEAAQEAAKVKTARIAAGAKFSRSAPSVRLARLERKHDRALDEVAAGMFGPINRAEVNARTADNARATRQAAGVTRSGRRSGSSTWKSQKRPAIKQERRNQAEAAAQEFIAKNPEHPVAKAWQSRVEEIDSLRAKLHPEFGDTPIKDAPGLIGAEDVTVSPDAPFVGNPVEQSRMTGKPRVSSGRTFGHTRKPGSLKAATGGSVERARERQDVHNVVAERHAEAVRLDSIRRRVDKIKGAGTAVPERQDDVWVWTDKTVAATRIPAEVRKYLDHPDGLKHLPEAKQDSILEGLRKATLERRDWTADAESRAEFEKLAKDGKGVFVPRKLLGNAAKPQYIGGGKAVGAVDAVNNTQKALLVYAKLSYPVVQAVSNAAMNVIQQGFGAPINLTRSFKLDRMIGADNAAIIDDIMGQGAVVQAAFHGQGPVSHISQKLAHVMSSKVDTPARRAAFLHEAHKAGFDTPDKIKALLGDDAHVDDLVEVAQRSKEAIVDYGEMSPFERNVARRAIFVFPWLKGSTKYAGHFLRDHPIQAAALGMLGEQGAQIRDETLGPTPSYLRGSFSVGGRMVNPAGVNFFQTPASLGNALAHPTSGQLAGSLAPAPGAAVAFLTGKDDIGRKLDGNPVTALRQIFVEGAPLAAALRAGVAGQDGPAADAVRVAVGSHTSSKTFPDDQDALYRFLAGGLYPRRFDKGALNRARAFELSGR